jgi:formylglycine-generating enzyme required for sulfatase activity
MVKIFLSYRRDDSKWPAQMIYKNLCDHFGPESIAFDISTIPLGVDFRDYLNQEVSKCDILLAVIGDQWLEILNQRLDQPNDFVRIEIQAALKREIPVVPILVGSKPVPSEKELPQDLAELSYKQATEVRAGADLQSHLKRLIDGLDRLFTDRKVGKEIKQEQVDKELKHEKSLRKTTNSIGMEFILIPSGSFTMGSSTGNKDEEPPREIKISRFFFLQATQVTQGQWKEVMEYNPSHFKDCGIDCPVENVSWDDAQRFIQKLYEKEGNDRHRLPTEAEWEYACRAGTTNVYSFGDNKSQLEEYAWFADNSQSKTHPSGTRKPNPWGLYDMHGNVYEWVEDDYHDNYKNAPDDGSSWVDDPRGTLRVIRGGSWFNDSQYCRSANRYSISPNLRLNFIGFRLARSVTLGT